MESRDLRLHSSNIWQKSRRRFVVTLISLAGYSTLPFVLKWEIPTLLFYQSVGRRREFSGLARVWGRPRWRRAPDAGRRARIPPHSRPSCPLWPTLLAPDPPTSRASRTSKGSHPRSWNIRLKTCFSLKVFKTEILILLTFCGNRRKLSLLSREQIKYVLHTSNFAGANA